MYNNKTLKLRAPELRAILVDEERAVIEIFGGNPPVCHHRINTTNPDGDVGDKMYLSGLSAFLLSYIHIFLI